MDQTHVMYYYWQQPMTNTYVHATATIPKVPSNPTYSSMPMISRVQPKKQALAGVMRIVPEGTPGAW